jgi:PPOX class probable FMN-dependent enzyme
MRIIKDIAALTAIYDKPVGASLTKVASHLTPLYRRWIGTARFCVLSTVGAHGTDASPRGDDGPVVRIVDDTTLWMPDWRGNNRLDCLRNIVTDGRVSLMFMVPGALNVVRVNGRAVLSDDPALTHSFEQAQKHPKTVIVITVQEVYFQCAKALMRSGLWSRDDHAGLPSAGDFIKEMDAGFDAAEYDLTYPTQAPKRMW